MTQVTDFRSTLEETKLRRRLKAFQLANNLLGHFTRACRFKAAGMCTEYLQLFFKLLQAGHHPGRIHQQIDHYAQQLKAGEPGHPTEFLNLMEVTNEKAETIQIDR